MRFVKCSTFMWLVWLAEEDYSAGAKSARLGPRKIKTNISVNTMHWRKRLLHSLLLFSTQQNGKKLAEVVIVIATSLWNNFKGLLQETLIRTFYVFLPVLVSRRTVTHHAPEIPLKLLTYQQGKRALATPCVCYLQPVLLLCPPLWYFPNKTQLLLVPIFFKVGRFFPAKKVLLINLNAAITDHVPLI